MNSTATEQLSEIMTVDTQLPSMIKTAAQARVKVVRAAEMRETGAAKTNLSDVCRDILLNWEPGQTVPRAEMDLPDLVQCVFCDAMVTTYGTGKLRAHGPVGKRCPVSYFSPDHLRMEWHILSVPLAVPGVDVSKAEGKPETVNCPACHAPVSTTKTGKLKQHGNRKCAPAWVQLVPISSALPPEGEGGDKMRFPMNRARYEAIRDRIAAEGQSVAHVLAQLLEHFAVTGNIGPAR